MKWIIARGVLSDGKLQAPRFITARSGAWEIITAFSLPAKTQTGRSDHWRGKRLLLGGQTPEERAAIGARGGGAMASVW